MYFRIYHFCCCIIFYIIKLPRRVKYFLYGVEYYFLDLTGDNINGGIHEITCSEDIGDAAKKVLRAFALLPEAGAVAADYGDGDYISFNNTAAERLVSGGGNYNYTAYAGVFYSHGLSYDRTSKGAGVGFRAAYAELPTE